MRECHGIHLADVNCSYIVPEKDVCFIYILKMLYDPKEPNEEKLLTLLLFYGSK